jgi:hypothetical protein
MGNRNVATTHRRMGLRFRIELDKICAIYPQLPGLGLAGKTNGAIFAV